jgi:hypothetical protein
MRIIACLSWYDENPAWLAALVGSLKGIADHIVAVDGAYALYPNGKPHSPRGQAEVIREAARSIGAGCTIHEPLTVWWGNEVGKRDFMFHLAETVAKPNEDWYFIVDGDEIVTKCNLDLHAALAATEKDVGWVRLWNYRQHYEPHERPFVCDLVERSRIPKLFRAIPGLGVKDRHYHYVLPDGRYLWCDGREQMANGDYYDDLSIEHRQNSRDLWRDKDRQDYYSKREATNIER